MGSEDKLINVTLKFNQDTGAIEIVSQKMKGIEDQAAKAGSSSDKLLGVLGGLLPAMSAIGAVKFLENAISESEKSILNIKQLKSVLDSLGISWDDNSAKVSAWARNIQANTKFSDDIAISSLKDLVLITGDLKQAQLLTKLAMDVSVATGKDYSDMLNKLGLVYQNNERGLIGMKKEFKGLFDEMADGQIIIDKFIEKFDGESEKGKGLSNTFSKIKSEVSDMNKEIGATGTVWIQKVIDTLSPLEKNFKSIFYTITTDLKAIFTLLGGIAEGFVALISLRFKDIPKITKATTEEIGKIIKDGDEKIRAIWKKGNEDEQKGAKDKGVIIATESEAQKEKRIKDETERAEITAKISKDELNTQLKAIDAKAAYFKSKGVEETIVNKWVQNEKAKAILDFTKQYIDIESDVSQIIDTLATGSAEERKYLVADLLEAEALANAKRLAMAAIVYAVQLNFVQAGIAAAEAAALTVVAGEIHASTEKSKAEDAANKKAVEDAKAAEEEKKKLREEFAKTTLDGVLADIDKQAQAYRDAGVDAAQVDAWVAKQKAQAKVDAANAAADAAKVSVDATSSNTSSRSEVTRTEQIIKIELGGIVFESVVINQEGDTDVICRDIANKVREKSLEGIRMAQEIHKAGVERSNYSI